MQPEYNEQMKQQIEKREKVRDSINEKDEMVKFVHELLLDDMPAIYNDEYENNCGNL